MQGVSKKTIVLIICLVSVTLLSGCTNWKKKYENLYVKYQNALGLLEHEKAENLSCRFRSLGCSPCTGAIESTATTPEQILTEVITTRKSERERLGALFSFFA